MYGRGGLAVVAVLLAVLIGAPPEAVAPSLSRTQASTSVAMTPARAVYDAMTPAQRAGQLFIVGVPSTGASHRALARLARLHVGNVVLDGASSKGRKHTRAVSRSVTAKLTTHGVAPYIATDQEGGEVQHLTGPGFAAMPSALQQGRLSRAELRLDATKWGRQLARAGVNLNFAPVADTVPAGDPEQNQPIGRYHREYGHTPRRVARHVTAVVQGESAGGIGVTLKHFPGIGRASGNTDFARHVTDPTSRSDPYLEPFRRGVAAGTGFVMVSLATYPNIDPGRPGALSRTVMTRMLRHDIGFGGVIVSDSLHAKAVAGIQPAWLAVRFVRAGGTMLLDTDVTPIAAMRRALVSTASAHPHFATMLRAAEFAVLQAKARAGLLRD